jgi:hypothetical protein
MVKFGERVDRHTLTINERVLLHIYERSTVRGVLEAPFPLTQQGIARALGMRVNHVSRAVKALQTQNFVTEQTARVRGEVRKRKVYLISHEGHAIAQALVNDLGRRLVLVRDERGVAREMAMVETRKLPGGPHSLTDILSNLDDAGVSDLSHLARGQAAVPLSHFEEGRPHGETFYGRTRELAKIAEWLASPTPAIHVVGPRGIGKSTLLTRALEAFEADRHTFWYTAEEDERPETILRALGAFLNSLGRGELSGRLMDRSLLDRETERILARDWPATNCVLVLDDADRAPPEVLRMLLGMIRNRGGKIVLTSEAPLPDLARLRAAGEVQTLPLPGLDKQDCRRFAPKGMAQEEFEKVYRLSGGNPLSIRLLAADALEGLGAQFTPEERALLRILKLRQDSD